VFPALLLVNRGRWRVASLEVKNGIGGDKGQCPGQYKTADYLGLVSTYPIKIAWETHPCSGNIGVWLIWVHYCTVTHGLH
jgi:hypothetical protein